MAAGKQEVQDFEVTWKSFLTVTSKQTEFYKTISGYIESLEFAGFKPKEFLFKFFKIGLAAGLSVPEIFADINLFCAWGLQTGSNMSQRAVDRKKDKDVALLFQTRAEVYGMKQNDPNVNEITIGRVLACCPHILLVSMYKTPSEKVRITGERPAELPRALCFPGAPALIPIAGNWDNLWRAWLKWIFNFDWVVNDGKGGRQLPNPEKVLNIGRAVRLSTQFEDAERLKMLTACAIIEVNVVKLVVEAEDILLAAAILKAKERAPTKKTK
jgi:hypothetical protein